MLDIRDFGDIIQNRNKGHFINFGYHYILGIANKDKYKDTLTSFVHSMLVCRDDDRPAIKDTFTDALRQLDKKFETETKDLVSSMERRINDVFKFDMPQCLKGFTNTLSEKYYYTFKLLWLSKISGFRNCDSNCLIDDTDDNNFIFRAMRDTIVLGVDKDLSCSAPSADTCNEALQAILDEKFTSGDYKKQKTQLKTAIDSMIGNLNNSYLDWLQRPGMAECRNNMTKICSGKLSIMHRTTLNLTNNI